MPKKGLFQELIVIISETVNEIFGTNYGHSKYKYNSLHFWEEFFEQQLQI